MYGYIAGDEQFRDAAYPNSDDTIDDTAGEWIQCPECGSDDAGMLYWGEGVDTDFYCPDCGAGHGVR